MNNRQFAILKTIKLLIVSLAMLTISATIQADDINESLSPPIEGRLSFTGSLALNNLISLLAQSFADSQPLVTVTLVDSGGMAGIDALINGSADIVLTSTPISDKQEKDFELRFGHPPEVITVAMDALVVYVNNLNPLTSISIQNLDAIFSSTLRCSEAKPIKTWEELGVKTGLLAKREIHTYGLTVNTGATSLFRQVVLCGGDFMKDFQALPGAAAIELALTSDYAGIGFSNSAMRSAELHALAIKSNNKTTAITPNSENIRSKRYPMSRTLAIVINHRTDQPVSPLLQAFIKFIRSSVGENIIRKAGYVTLPAFISHPSK